MVETAGLDDHGLLVPEARLGRAGPRAGGVAGGGQQPEPEPLKWRFMGPSVGNRIAAVAGGVPGDPTIDFVQADKVYSNLIWLNGARRHGRG